MTTIIELENKDIKINKIGQLIKNEEGETLLCIKKREYVEYKKIKIHKYDEIYPIGNKSDKIGQITKKGTDYAEICVGYEKNGKPVRINVCNIDGFEKPKKMI